MLAPYLKYPKNLGGLVHQCELARALARRGHEVHLLTQQLGPWKDYCKKNDVITHEIKLSNLPYVFLLFTLFVVFLRKVLVLHKRHNFDIIHDRGYIFGGVGGVAGSLLHIPTILQVDNDWVEQAHLHILTSDFFLIKKEFYKFGTRLVKIWQRYVAVSCADHIIVVSDQLRKIVIHRWKCKKRISVIRNSANTERFNPRVNSVLFKKRLGLLDKRIIVFVGEVSPWQGTETLLNAMVKVTDHVPSVVLLIVGGAHIPFLKKMKELQKRFNLSNVFFLGKRPYSEIPRIVACADIAVAPFDVTTAVSPLKIFEYMAAGKPIVSTKLPDIYEILEDGKNAILVDPTSASQLADAIVTLLLNQKLASTLGRNARHLAEEKYSWDKNAENVERIYSGLKF